MAKNLNSSGQKNTLLSYFQTTPKKNESGETSKVKAPATLGNSNRKSPKKPVDDSSDSSDEEINVPKSNKKRIRKLRDSDSDTENVSTPKKTKRDLSSFNFLTPKSLKKDTCNSSKVEESSNSSQVEESFNSSKAEDDIDISNLELPSIGGDPQWLHTTLDFLKPEKIMDIHRRPKGHPEYDEKSLYVPDAFLHQQTPAMRQWWILKRKYFDTVLFFKVGKFYELYHMDAVVGVNNLGFSYMKGEFAHSGFPEMAYGKMASSLIDQGFKVARIEQTETPEMMTERLRNSGKTTKFDKVVNREICQVSAKGCCLYGPQLSAPKKPQTTYLLAIAEDTSLSSTSEHLFGVCFIDISIGVFHLGEFKDDKHCSRLLALLATCSVGTILTESGRLSSTVNTILKRDMGNFRRENLTPETQFYGPATTVKCLLEEVYFLDKNEDHHWPKLFETLLENTVPKKEYSLAIKSLGACIWYLESCKIDVQVLTRATFEMYYPFDTVETSKTATPEYMVLDHITMNHLNLFGDVGSLQKLLDHCMTAFGKRLLHGWICRPLCNIQQIQRRQAALREFRHNEDLLQSVRVLLTKLPDLERQVTKIHIFGNRFCAEDHPDSRAIFYEAKTYSKRRIMDLVTTLQGFETLQKIPDLFKDCESPLLQEITQHSPKGNFVDLTETLQFFEKAFDQDEASKEGKIIPQRGVDEECDRAEDTIADLNVKLEEYLNEQKKFFGCRVSYFGTDKKRFQLEVPQDKCHKVTKEYLLEGARKGSRPVKRYSTPKTKEFLANMLKAENERAKIVQDLNRRIFEKFSERREEWEEVIRSVAILDVLSGLAEYSRVSSYETCIPEIQDFDEKPTLKIENGRHPCILSEDFIPNDSFLGGNERVMILTGPNMGGKSTLMKQVALIIVLAQMGSYVPATYCRLNLVDRIFTRIGAYDDIIHNQSTFLVELSEASTILHHATHNSFAIIDELGRGTSTHDGTAIATAYVGKLLETKCRAIFTTHYNTLVRYYTKYEGVQLSHMSCLAESEDDEGTEESVTFLYKLAEGVCPKSFGFNAAKLAGLPATIIKRARTIANELERTSRNRQLIRQIFTCPQNQLRDLLAALKV